MKERGQRKMFSCQKHFSKVNPVQNDNNNNKIVVKKLFNERAQQLQKENIKKSQLQQREEELSDLEMERDELLLIEKRDEQQNIGE